MSGPVGGGDEDDALALAEPVHLDQQLVEGLFALVVTAAQASAALPADGVDLVDEDDAREFFLWPARRGPERGRRRRRRTSRRSPEPEMVKTAPRPTGTARANSLAGAGRAVEQHAQGNLGAEGLVAAGILQGSPDLVELLDRLIGAGHIGEGGLGHVLDTTAAFELPNEAHPPAGLHPGEQHEQRDQQQQRKHVDQQRAQHARLIDGRVGLDTFGGERVEQRHRVTGGYFAITLVESPVSPLPLLSSSRTCCSRSSIWAFDVVGVDLGNRDRGVDRF